MSASRNSSLGWRTDNTPGKFRINDKEICRGELSGGQLARAISTVGRSSVGKLV